MTSAMNVEEEDTMHTTAQEGDGPTEVPKDQGMLLTLVYACRVHFQRENITLMQAPSLN